MRNNHTTKKHDKSTVELNGGSLIDVRKKKNGEEMCSFSSVATAITDEIFPIAVQQEDNNIIDANSNGPKQNKGLTNNSSSSSKQHQQKKQPLFAAVIQNWFLEERMKARGMQLGSKKSKKKKKKKKKGAQAAIVTDDDGGGNDANGESAMISLENGVTLSSTSQSAATTSLDCVLDKFIDLQKDSVVDYELNVVDGRDLQSFTTFLGQKFESYLDEQQQSQKLRCDTNQTLFGMDFVELLPTILMADVNNNAQKAECACGYAIRSHLNTWTDKYRSVEQRIVLEAKTENEEDDILGHANENENGLSIPVCTNYLDAENDDPFAYGALIDDDFDLEAGAQSSEQQVEKIEGATSALRLELRQISSPNDAARYLQVDPVYTQNNEGVKCVYPIDEQSILNLVKCIIVPSGIGEGGDIDAHECALNDKDIYFIKDRAESSENEFVHQFFDMLRSSETAKTKLMAAREEHARRTIFDPKTTVGLRGADEELNSLLRKMIQFLIRVTKYSCCVGWCSDKPTPISIVTKLWNEFDRLLVDLVKPALNVRGTEIQVKRRPGKVPQAFCNTAVRNCHDQLISLKIDKVDRLLYFLRSEFLHRPDCNSNNFLKTKIPSPMLRLCVLEAYSMRKHKISADDVFSNEESLESLNAMLDAKMELPQVNYHTTLRAVELSEKARVEKFKLAYKKVVETVTKADAHLACQSSPDVASLVSGAEMYESKRLNYELEEKNPSGSTSLLSLDYDDDPTNLTMEEDITRALNKSGALWMQWIYTLCMENYSASPSKKFHINRELKIYMDGEVKNPCEGGGERKVSVILATLIYRWLEAKYNEWHAELTREELLQEATELTTPQITTKGAASKKSKKKKSRQKKRDKEENNESSTSANVVETSSSNVDGESADDAGINAEIVATVTEEGEESATVPITNVLDFDDAFHSTSDVGWTTVGANTSKEDVQSTEENNTARDEEIARALQEQFREEAKQYEAENMDTLSMKESSVENAASIAEEENTKKNEISDDTAPSSATKSSGKAKTKKQSKSHKAKAKQTRNSDAKDIASQDDVAVKDESATSNCAKTGDRAAQSQSKATPDKKPAATTMANDESLTTGNDANADKSVAPSQSKVEADKKKQVTEQTDDEFLTSNGAKEDKNVDQKSQSNADKKKQVATEAAAKVHDESSTSNGAKSSNSVANSQDETDKKQKQVVTTQATDKPTNEYYRPKVGVYDGDHFVDAETYLVGRMKRVKKKLVWL
jgi:hypothetical protein